MEESEGLQGGRSLEEAQQRVLPTPPQKSTRPQSACAACGLCGLCGMRPVRHAACAACGLCGTCSLCDLQPVRHVRHAAFAACGMGGMGGMGGLGGWFGPASARRLCAASPDQPTSRPADQPTSRPADQPIPADQPTSRPPWRPQAAAILTTSSRSPLPSRSSDLRVSFSGPLAASPARPTAPRAFSEVRTSHPHTSFTPYAPFTPSHTLHTLTRSHTLSHTLHALTPRAFSKVGGHLRLQPRGAGLQPGRHRVAAWVH